MARRVFLVVYFLSGAAALLYQVTWTRLLTLHLGHTVAAVGTVLAAFMGGLAMGAAGAGRIAPRLSPPRALVIYAVLEAVMGACALLLPLGLFALQPLLRVAYADGGGTWFGLARVATSLLLIALPAAMMGATLPMAVRGFAGRPDRAAGEAGLLYAVNTIGAACGAALTGFVLLPALGLRLTTLAGVAANVVAAAVAWRLASSLVVAPVPRPISTSAPARVRRGRAQAPMPHTNMPRPWLAAAALGVSGGVALLYEVVWTRALALVLGPTTYAFSTMLVAFIIGIAAGAAVASRAADRVRRPLVWLGSMLALAALGAFGAWAAVGQLPLTIAELVSAPGATLTSIAVRQAVIVGTLLVPMTLAFGAAFPFAVAAATRGAESLSADVAIVYAVNTVGAMAGALAGSFFFVPALGLQRSIGAGGLLLALAAIVVAVSGTPRTRARLAIAAGGLAVAAAAVPLPPWNPQLVSSGAYKYAIDAAGDLQASLEAGELLSYAEGASGIVSVRRVAGTTSLAIDGKVDASNGADMLTQKLLAHLPLLLHPSPRRVAVIGLGSGVTVGAALRHPVARVEVLEISPEVVAASSFFRMENHDALDDPRTRLIVADGRTHLTLSRAPYDVLISEPSNPWMAGIAALFTREFFAAARERLAPGGVFCQWAHTYDITEDDLRSIVATFHAVFPDGGLWLVGDGDLLLIGADSPVVDRLPQIARPWPADVAADLAASHATPFGLLSLFVADGSGLAAFGTAPVQTDDRLALEFSGPRGIYGTRGRGNVEILQRLTASHAAPPEVANALASATPAMWRELGLMHLDAKAADRAYDALARAVTGDGSDAQALAALARAAALAGREAAARALLEELAHRERRNVAVRMALSRLLAAAGQTDAALAAADEGLQVDPSSADAREQLASVIADLGDVTRLDPVVQVMVRDHPDRPGTLYYQAVLRFLRGEFAEALVIGERAAAADPRNARVQNLLGAAFASLGRPDRARAAFEASRAADPTDPSALANLGTFELQANNPAAAAARFAEALLLDPAYEPALAGLAEALERQGESTRAARVRRP
ncbi:MAG: tetratricopeptide repeat protein [Acidobacteria bacterium]|nr:tetratricopeptide repeat protein [Acidobacteriota bacterium]